jgi:SAM-dependent methyltransferase
VKIAAVEVLVCPSCKEQLSFRIASRRGKEILEGSLRCESCAATYPIRRGVPRFVPEGAYAESFGSQWNWFRTVQLDSLNATTASERALRAATGWSDADYPGRLLLDAGVGAGRFAERAAAKGAQVFGVDLTTAVDAAYRNIGERDNVHLIQADIFALPFRAHSFDLAYSIGVLHHTPDPPAAFARVAETVKPGGRLAVYLYARYGSSHAASDAIRIVTTRLPLGMMWLLSSTAIPLYYLYRLPVLGSALRLALPISMESNWRWRWLDTFDWYTPIFQWKYLYPEVYRWFRGAGFEDVELFDGPIRMSGQKALVREPVIDRDRRRHNVVAS